MRASLARNAGQHDATGQIRRRHPDPSAAMQPDTRKRRNQNLSAQSVAVIRQLR
jgi:hypothetical protein